MSKFSPGELVRTKPTPSQIKAAKRRSKIVEVAAAWDTETGTVANIIPINETGYIIARHISNNGGEYYDVCFPLQKKILRTVPEALDGLK